VKDLVGILLSEPPLKVNLNSLFDPSKFLVSPFNNTDRFIRGEYFLTNQQKVIKDSILGIIKKNTYEPCAISGKAGTGKTLLVYDIAKEMMLNQNKVLIVHCGKLNEGHEKLRDSHKIDLITIKYFTEQKVNENYNLIIFDEAQRIHLGQTNTLLKNKNKSNYLFSY
jgi:MoxR-like ATPase